MASENNNTVSNEPSAKTILRHQKISRLIFPEVNALVIIEKQTEEIIQEHARFSNAKAAGMVLFSDMNPTIPRSNQLLVLVEDFHEEQLLRVKDIRSRERDAEQRILDLKGAKAANFVRLGMLLPVQSIAENWEIDTIIEEKAIERDEFDEGIDRQELKLADLADRFRFEGLLHQKLKAVIEGSVRGVKFPSDEGASWTKEHDTDILFKLPENQRRESNMKAILWMRGKIYAADASTPSDTMSEYSDDGDNHDGGLTPEPYTAHGGGQSLSTNGSVQNMFAPQSLHSSGHYQLCHQGVHGSQGSASMKAGDGGPTVCFYCGKFGHTEEKCFELHPELLDLYRKSKPRPFCNYCQKGGHWKKFCRLFQQQAN